MSTCFTKEEWQMTNGYEKMLTVASCQSNDLPLGTHKIYSNRKKHHGLPVELGTCRLGVKL